MALTQYHESLLKELEALYPKLYYTTSQVTAVKVGTVGIGSQPVDAYQSGSYWMRDEVTELQTKDTQVWARIQAIQTILASATPQDQVDDLENMLTAFQEAYENAKSANLERYDQLIADAATAPDPLYVMSYPQLAYHTDTAYLTPITTDWENLETDQLARDDEVIEVLQDDWTELDDRLQQIGDRARNDIGDRFRSMLSRAQQGLIDSGVYNSTLNAAAVSGMAAGEAAELARLDETLGGQQVEALSRIQTVRQQERRQRLQNRLGIVQGKLGWQAERARRMAELYKLAPAVVEGRTDIGPNLNDIANLAMQIGRGQGSQQMIGAFQSSQFISKQGAGGTGFDFAGFMQKAITQQTVQAG